MAAYLYFITGTDTGVGKTVLTAGLTRSLRQQGIHAAALKPVCSGGRDDARRLHQASGGVLSLDEINPWYYRAALAPLQAARQERKKLRLAQVVRHIQKVAKEFDVLVVEGAGGLLSPLGEDFDSRDLILALKATPMIVAPNRLGVVGQVRLVMAALPTAVQRKAEVVLVNPPKADAASRTNPGLLREYVAADQVLILPWVKQLK